LPFIGVAEEIALDERDGAADVFADNDFILLAVGALEAAAAFTVDLRADLALDLTADLTDVFTEACFFFAVPKLDFGLEVLLPDDLFDGVMLPAVLDLVDLDLATLPSAPWQAPLVAYYLPKTAVVQPLEGRKRVLGTARFVKQRTHLISEICWRPAQWFLQRTPR
jgi:hypothetical protein